METSGSEVAAWQPPTGEIRLRSVSEIPYQFQNVFSSSFQSFNKAQSLVFEELLENDKSLGKFDYLYILSF